MRKDLNEGRKEYETRQGEKERVNERKGMAKERRKEERTKEKINEKKMI